MRHGLKITVVMPCYNEEEGVAECLRQMPSFVDEVIVVDNNSSDRTGDVAREGGAKVVFEGGRPTRGERLARLRTDGSVDRAWP